MPFYSELFPTINLQDSGKKFPIHFSPSNHPSAFIFMSKSSKYANDIINLTYDIKKKQFVRSTAGDPKQTK